MQTIHLAGPVEDERIEDAERLHQPAHPIWIRQPSAVYDVTSNSQRLHNSVSMGAPNKNGPQRHTPDTHPRDTHTNLSLYCDRGPRVEIGRKLVLL